MRAITERVDVEAKSLGIEVVDVRLKRADLPEANSQAIYERMKTERQREAAEIRAQGVEASKRIKATADRQVTVTIAEANRDSERTRGEGDAERNRIYAEAFGRDQDFFAFYRSMQAYEEGLKSNDTRLVISPSSEFFQYFNDPSGASRPPEQRTPGTPGGSPSPTSSQAAR
jgi:membrane protease subunit HflC